MNNIQEFELWTTTNVTKIDGIVSHSDAILTPTDNTTEFFQVWAAQNAILPKEKGDTVVAHLYPLRGTAEEILQDVIRATADTLAVALKNIDPVKYSGSVEEESKKLIERTVA